MCGFYFSSRRNVVFNVLIICFLFNFVRFCCVFACFFMGCGCLLLYVVDFLSIFIFSFIDVYVLFILL